MPGTSAKIFVAESQVRPLDPVVTNISPAHDAPGVRPTTPVVIHFSRPMDVSSVEQAFSTVPPVTGSFSWSPTHDVMTFRPGGNGFPVDTMITVRMGESARDTVSERKFYAGFESRFYCAAAD